MDYIKSNGCYQLLLPLDDREISPLTYNVAIVDITKFSPGDFAKQITLIEISLFRAIKREEFSSLKWNGKEKHNYAPNIVASTKWFNQINFWVQKEILKYSCVSKRTELLSFFIKIAKKLVELNNLYSAMSIVSALQVECIYRLRHTWSGLGNKDRTTYRRLEELFSQDDNCRRQREHMNSIALPGIPYLGLYLSDLTYTNVAHPRAGGKTTDVWSKKINAIIDAIAHFQRSEYLFPMDESIHAYLCAQRYIEELQKFLEEDNYKTSVRLEPPSATPPLTHVSPSYTAPVVEKERKLSGFLGNIVSDGGGSGPFKALPSLAASFQGFGFRSPSQPRSSGSSSIPKFTQVDAIQSNKAALVNCSFQGDPLPSSITSAFDASKITPSTPIGRVSKQMCSAFAKQCSLTSSNELLVEDEFVADKVTARDFTEPTARSEFKQPFPPDQILAYSSPTITPVKQASHHISTNSHHCTELDSKLMQPSSSYVVPDLSETGDVFLERSTHRGHCDYQQLPHNFDQLHRTEPTRPLLINSTTHSPQQPPTVPPRRSVDTDPILTTATAATDGHDSLVSKWCLQSTTLRLTLHNTHHSLRPHLASRESLDSTDDLVHHSNVFHDGQSRSASLPVSRSGLMQCISTQLNRPNVIDGTHRSNTGGNIVAPTRLKTTTLRISPAQSSLDAAAAATAVQAIDRNITNCPPFFKCTTTDDGERELNELAKSTHDAVNATNGAQIARSSQSVDRSLVALARSSSGRASLPTQSTQATTGPQLFRPSLLQSVVCTSPINLGVSVVFQGILQRRRVIIPTGSDSPTKPLASASPWLKNHQYLSTSSLPHDNTATPSIRPLSFSRWRRFWASLVRVDYPSATYGLLILFEATRGNATRRDQFDMNQCHLQRLMHTSDTYQHIQSVNCMVYPTSERHTTKVSTSPSMVNGQHSERRSTIAPNVVWTRVYRGYHQDGSVDNRSFLLTHPARNRVYRYRPIVPLDSNESGGKDLIKDKMLHQQSPGLLGWLRRSFTRRRSQSRKGSFDLIDADSDNEEGLLNIDRSSRTVGTTAHETSLPAQFYSPVCTPSNSRVSTLRSTTNNSIDVHCDDCRQTFSAHNAFPRETVELVSNSWILAIQSELDNCKEYVRTHTLQTSTEP